MQKFHELWNFSWSELAESYENNKGAYAIYKFIFFDGIIGKTNIFNSIMLVHRYYISKDIGSTLIHLNLQMINT